MARRIPGNSKGSSRRVLPPELKRLAEDHGVCPWFLRDDEFPQLARIFNLHRRYRDILTRGMVLPENSYRPHAVSRGDGKTRLITLRNLTWEPVTHRVALSASSR